MNKKRIVCMIMGLLMTMMAGCKKTKDNITEITTLPETETTATILEIVPETAAPTVDVLKEVPTPYEDVPVETTKAQAPENQLEVPRSTETTPPVTESTKPTETTPPETPKPLETPRPNETPDW